MEAPARLGSRRLPFSGKRFIRVALALRVGRLLLSYGTVVDAGQPGDLLCAYICIGQDGVATCSIEMTSDANSETRASRSATSASVCSIVSLSTSGKGSQSRSARLSANDRNGRRSGAKSGQLDRTRLLATNRSPATTIVASMIPSHVSSTTPHERFWPTLVPS